MAKKNIKIDKKIINEKPPEIIVNKKSIEIERTFDELNFAEKRLFRRTGKIPK